MRGGLPEIYSFVSNMHKPSKIGVSDYEVSYGGYVCGSSNGNMYGVPPIYKRCYLKHYYTKSFEEFLEKEKRGYPDGTNLKINLKTFEYFSTEKYDFEKMLLSSALNVENFKNIPNDVGNYHLIKLKTKNNNVFALFYYCILLLFYKSNITIFIDQDIDNEIYNTLFGLSFNNGNRVITKIDKDMENKVINKYASVDENYYYILEAK